MPEPDPRLLAGIDIGGTKVTASIAGRDGILAKVYQQTRKSGEPEAVPGQVVDLVGQACRLAGLDPRRVRALGVSTCSPFERRDGRLEVVAPNLCGGLSRGETDLPNRWTSIPLERELARRYRRLAIGNDCLTAAVAERLFGIAQGEDDFIYVTWSTGIGAGAYVNGRLLAGKNSNAMHLGHIFLGLGEGPEPVCGCGTAGHLEAYASGAALARETGVPAAETFRRLREGGAEAAAVVRRAARLFARGLASAAVLLDPSLIVLGGGIAGNWDLLRPLVEEQFYASLPPLTAGVRLRPTALGPHLGDLASLSLVLPPEWVLRWQEEEPWLRAPQPVVLPA